MAVSEHFRATLVRGHVEDAVSRVTEALPGHGMYRGDLLGCYGLFFIDIAERISGLAGPKGTAAALRRLADAVERERLEDLRDELTAR